MNTSDLKNHWMFKDTGPGVFIAPTSGSKTALLKSFVQILLADSTAQIHLPLNWFTSAWKHRVSYPLYKCHTEIHSLAGKLNDTYEVFLHFPETLKWERLVKEGDTL